MLKSYISTYPIFYFLLFLRFGRAFNSFDLLNTSFITLCSSTERWSNGICMIVSIVFRKIKILPFGSRKSTSYDIRQLTLFWFEKMIHIHIASGSPAGCHYMTQFGTYEHQGALAVRKSTDRFCTTFSLTVETLNRVIGPDPGPMLRRKIHIGQGFLDSVLHLFGRFGKLHRPEFFRYLEHFSRAAFLLSCAWIALSIRATVFILFRGVTENIFL